MFAAPHALGTAPNWISPAGPTRSVPCEPATICMVTAFVAASYAHVPAGGGGGGGGVTAILFSTATGNGSRPAS